MPLSVLALLIGCAKDTGSAEVPARVSAPAQRDVTPPERPSNCPMISFVPHVTAARDAILKNDVSLIQVEMGWMTASGTLPATLTPPVMSSATAAASPDEAEAPRAAALFLGELGVVCGDCHTGHGPALAQIEAPSSATGVLPHMHRHMWAADRMWEGLIGPSEPRWNQGVALLSGLDLDPAQFSGRDEQDSPAGYLTPWIRRIGLESLRTGDPETRGRLYGDLLATCAECHAGTLGAPDPQHPLPR